MSGDCPRTCSKCEAPCAGHPDSAGHKCRDHFTHWDAPANVGVED